MPRRSTLAWPFLTFVLSLTFSSVHADAQVHLFNWTDYFAEDTLVNFEKQTGIHPTLDEYEDSQPLDDKLKAGNSGYDLVFPTALPFAADELKKGLFQPLDKARLPGLSNLDPEIMKSLAKIDPGNRYLVPYMWGTTGLGINVEKVQAVVGDKMALDTWRLILDPKYASKLSACGISLLNDPTEVFGAALAYLGRNPNSLEEDDLRAAAAVIRAILPYVNNIDSANYPDKLADGSLCVAQGYSGDIITAQDEAEEAGKDLKIYYAVPREGAAMWIDVMAIPKDAPDPDAAMSFIQYLLDPQVIADISNYVYYANPNLPAKSLIDEDLRYNSSIYPPPVMRVRMFTLKERSDREAAMVDLLWEELKKGR